MRTCIMTLDTGNERGLFHGWATEAHPVGAVLVGQTAGQVAHTFAIVEDETGFVHALYPQRIRFTDSADVFKQYCWGGGQDA